MEKCNLSKNKEFKAEFLALLNVVTNINKDDKERRKQVYLDGLLKLKNDFSSDTFFLDLSEIFKDGRNNRMIRSSIQNLSDLLIDSNKDFITFEKELSTSDNSGVESTLDLGSKFDKFDSTKSEQNDVLASKDFLTPYFPMASGSRLSFELDFKYKLILKLFFNEHGLINKSGEEIDRSIKSLRNDLEKDLDEYVKSTQDAKYYNEVYKSLNINAKLLLFGDMLNPENENRTVKISGFELLKIPIINSLENALKLKLKAYLAYIALSHFDDLISQAFGDSVRIYFKNNYSTDKLKYSINLGDRNVTSWSDESKDIDESEQIGGIVRLYMESLDLYDPITGKKLPQKMTFNDVKSGITGIMKFLESNNNDIRTRKYFDPRREDSNHVKNMMKTLVGKYYGEEGFDKIWNEYFLGKTLPQVIAATKRSPNLLTPALFACLVSDRGIKFERYLEKQAIYSIFKNIFEYRSDDSNNSLLSKIASVGINIDSADIFSYVTTLFVNLENLRMIEYRRENDGSMNIINIIQNTENARLNGLKYQWEGKYNVGIPQKFESFTLSEEFNNVDGGKELSVEIGKEASSQEKFTLKIKLNKDTGDITTNLYKGTKIVSAEDVQTLPEDLLNFLSEVFDKKIDNNFIQLFKDQGEKGGLTIEGLFNVAGSILFNYKLGKLILNKIKNDKANTLKKIYDDTLDEFYKERPRAMRGTMLPELTNKGHYLTMIGMAKTLDFLQGYSAETMARDGSRKQISLVGLSSLMSRYMEIVYNHNLGDPNSILKDFNLYNIFEGVEFVRAYSGYDEKKQGTAFSENEFFAANFLYDFYGQQLQETKDGKRSTIGLEQSAKPTKFRAMGPVISDKPRVPKIVVDWNNNVNIPGEQPKKIWELTAEDIYKILKHEFGLYYIKLHGRILNDLRNVLDLIRNLNLNRYSVVFAHPAIGKTYSITKGNYTKQVLDWDELFNNDRDAWIEKNSGVKKSSKEFKKIRNEYLINPENHQDYIQFLTQRWNEAKAKAKSENKILVASPHILLKLFPKDFNAIINIDENTFVKRNVERNANDRKNSILWKQGIDNTINDLIAREEIKQSDVFTTDRYLEDILSDSTLDYDDDFESFNLYARVRGMKAEELIHNAIYEYQRLARLNGETDDNDIKIIDNIHYVKGGDGLIHNNVSLFHQLSIYGQAIPYKIRQNLDYLPNLDLSTINETEEQSNIRIKTQLLSELIRGETLLKLGEAADSTKYSAKEHNKDWMQGKSVIVYGRISDGNSTINLYSNRSFKSWKEYNQTLNLLKNAYNISENKSLKTLIDSIDVNNPKFDLSKAIETVNKYNKYTKLFTFNTETNKRDIRDAISLTLQLPDELTLKAIIKEDLIYRNPNWSDDAIERNVEKRLQNEETSRKIYTNWYINELVSKLFDEEQSLGAYDLLESFVTTYNILPQIFNLQINPELERYSALNNWIYESYMLTTVGSFIAHPADSKATTILNYEFSLFGQQVKRNVSQTATKHREVLDSIKGIRNRLRFAIVEDERDSYITYKGDYKKNGIKVHDGGTIYNGTMNLLDNNSLGADAMGQDKKPYLHFIDVATGIGGLLKTAGFINTNSHIQASPRYERLNRIMNDTIKWSETIRKFKKTSNTLLNDGRYIFNWLLDFKNDVLEMPPIYVYSNGQWYKRYGFEFDLNTGETSYFQQKIYDNGEPKNSESEKINAGVIDSNYQLWNLFGGKYSGHMNSDGHLSYYNDNSSFLNINYVMNHTGMVLNKELPVHSQANLLQILKESQIDMIPTMGAVKFGATNINTTLMFDDDNYKVTYTEVISDDFGEQLNAEHQVEGGHVSLMTLVINAIGARGYSREDAEECYEALESLALLSFEEAFDGLVYDREKLKVEIANILLNALKNVSLADGDILSAIATQINKIQKFLTYSDIEKRFPISSPLIFNNLVSKLASSLEKAAIRLKFDGGMLVLNPSNRIFQIINGKLSGRVSENELKEIQVDAFNNKLQDGSQIKMGRSYFVLEQNETGELKTVKAKLVDNNDDFYYILSSIKSGKKVIEAFTEELTITDDNEISFNFKKPLGRDLATYDVTVTAKDGRLFSAWEFDVVRQLHAWDRKSNKFKVNENRPQTVLEREWNKWLNGSKPSLELIRELNKLGISEIDSDILEKKLLARLLNTLNAIGSGIGNEVLIDGEIIKIDKDKTKTSPYEVILPMLYRTSFGLEEGDTVGEIKQDEFFFLKRFIKNSESKVYNSKFDLELKRTSGEHVYLRYKAPDENVLMRGATKVDIKTELVGNSLYRLDPSTGKRMYLLPSVEDENGIITENCVIYKDRGGSEIIFTNDLSMFLNLLNYNSISFGDLSKRNVESVKNILLQLESSLNESAKHKAEYVINAINRKVHTNIEGIKNQDYDYLKALSSSHFDLDEYQKYLDINSISEIFDEGLNSSIALNALQNHTLYKNDLANQEEDLKQLKRYITGEELLKDNKGNIIETTPENIIAYYSKEKPYIKRIIDFGIKLHTSFLTSLLAIVSRTPAQSQQSFMAMLVVGFDPNRVNSIYVSRMQLFLQGSDFDIDKANVLGLKFNNGILVTWSPYFDLTTYERSTASELLPFPTGKQLNSDASPIKSMYEYIEKDYTRYSNEDGTESIVDNYGNSAIVTYTRDEDGNILSADIRVEDSNINNYLVQHAAFNNIQKGVTVTGNFNKNVFNVDENGAFTGINNIEDLKFFVNSYVLDLSNIKTYYKNLRTIIKAFNKSGSIIPELEDTRSLVDKHNTYFLDENGRSNSNLDKKKRDALYNFVSIKVKNISKDPVNLIQGLSGIDLATDFVKDLVKPGGKFDRLSAIAETSDSRTTYSRIRQLVLTLTGKDNVGIVASAMKVFEAISHYYYKVLAEGSREEQNRLLSSVRILGKDLKLIANSFVKNRDCIKDLDVLEAYDKVDNTQDAFIMMSALLSLATDNAKDPTLSKLNATPLTIGCYTAGLVLGLNIEEVAELLISNTGIMLANMTKGNVFDERNKKFNKLGDAIKYLQYPPQYPGDIKDVTLLFENFGLRHRKDRNGKDIEFTKGDIRDFTLKNRKRIRELAKYVLDKEGTLVDDLVGIALREIEFIKEDISYWGWNKKLLDELAELLKKEQDNKELSKDEKKRLKKLKGYRETRENLDGEIRKYEDYIKNPEFFGEGTEINEILTNIKDKIDKIKLGKQGLNQIVNATDNLNVKEYFLDLLDWTDRREITDNDFIEKDGYKFNRLVQIRKLNSFNEEMGDLRTVLKLNQGLPNSIQDQLSWIQTFSRILSKAAYRLNRTPTLDNALGQFAEINDGTLELNLDKFLNDKEYLLAAIDAYEDTKVGVNVLAIMANSSHYRGYMKTMNLLYEGGKAVSINYNSQAWIVKNILPKLKLSDPEMIESFYKKITPVTFNRINQMFLWLLQVSYEIPKFDIIDGNLKEYKDENGNQMYETIRLGTDDTNTKFKDYVINYVYPYLKKNYPNNSFVLAIGLRSYSYNLDRKVTINLAKNQTYNMQNPFDSVRFDEVKKGLMELSGIPGIIPALFYYNLIAYNGQPGQQSLTSFFEDFIVYDYKSKVIKDYNNFITYLDRQNILIWTDLDFDYLIRALAPDVFSVDLLVNSEIPFAWIPNPENNQSVLLQLQESYNNNSRNPEEGDDQEDNYLQGLYEESGLLNEEGEFDNDEWGLLKKHAVYTSLDDILKRTMYRYINVDFNSNNLQKETSKDFILGTFKINTDFLKDLELDELVKDSTGLKKRNFLDENLENIILNIGGTGKNLLQAIEDNGWGKEQIYDSFVFIPRKSGKKSYSALDLDALKYNLDILLTQRKEGDCNG